ncbi:hypothetical protein IR083_07300 [Dysgonomonas sp. GY75]|uniref:hypothetical protein n=1 Tax=Dysgonomonas sp. GY75 TaxID=2780419 RepID=UPI0018841A8D|nr:hypothetical protein [Dysgonomonas sp. GY75]MBF0648621.1 hypothetical protein [Dysgonomonas sp. GY75]
MARQLIARGQVNIQILNDAYTISQSVNSYVFSAASNGTVPVAVTVVSTVKVTIGSTEFTGFTIGTVIRPAGFSAITVNNTDKTITYTVAAGTTNLAGNGIINIPVVIAGTTYSLSFSWSKARDGATGPAGADANLLDWVSDWNTNKTVIGSNSVITPKIFAGVKNTNGTLTGIALGRFPLSTLNASGAVVTETIDGLYGFKDGNRTFYIDNGGNVQLGRGNQHIKFNALTGKVEFGSEVSLNWIGATYIDANGIFTGTLSADAVNAVRINASQITAGMIDTARLNVDALKASLITAANIDALTLNVTKGKIGGWSIDADSIYRGTKNNTSGAYTGASGSVTIGSNGIRGFKWKLDSTGAGALAGGNIAWDASGNVTFGSSVSLNWTNAANDALNSARSYADTKKTEAISAAATDASNKINAVGIGGRNLIPLAKIGGTTDAGKFGDNTGRYKAISSAQWRIQNFTQPEAGYYSVGFWARADAAGKLGFDICDQNSKTADLTTGWVFVKFENLYVTNYLTSPYYGFIDLYNASGSTIGTLYISNLKVEYGTKCTTYTPAPEDTDSTINAVKSVADKNLAALGGTSYPKLTKITAEGIYTGSITASQITAGTIDAARINVDALKATLITAANIEALTLNVSKGKIGNWNIGSDTITTGTIGTVGQIPIQIRSSSSGSGYLYNGQYKPYGLSMLWYQDQNAGHVVFGQVVATGNTVKTGFIGIQMMSWDGNEYFCLSANSTKSGSKEVYNRIAGWAFDNDTIYRGTKNNTANAFTAASGSVSLGSNGIRGFKWRLDSTGAGAIAGGNISWDASGNITFGSGVSLNWTNAADTALASAKAYADTKKAEAVSTAATDASNKVNAVQVGGRNLLLNSGFQLGTANWGLTTNVSYDNSIKYNGNHCIRSIQSGLTADSWRGPSSTSQKYPVAEGEKYVASVYTMSDDISTFDNYATMEVDLVDAGGTRKIHASARVVPAKNNEWQRFSISFTVPAGYVSVYIWVYVTRNGKLWINSPQLEKGNKLTDWSPAPEDMNARLTKIDANGIYTGTLTASQVNAVSIDAAGIKTGTLSADRIAAGSIAAAKLDAASIKSGIINTDYINGLSCTFVRGKIGGWNIGSDNISAGVFGTGNIPVQLRSASSGSGYVYQGAYKPYGLTMSWHQSSNAGHFVFGQVMASGNSVKTDFVGIQMMAWDNTEYFCLSANYMKSGGKEIYNRIAGWAFDNDTVYRGTKNNSSGAFTDASGAISIGSNGIRGFKWRLDATGAGAVAGGNIAWDASGNVTFASSVSLNWTNAANTALASAKAYADTKKSEAISAAATDATTKSDAAKELAQAMAFGRMLYRDPTFYNGNNSANVYNNSNNGTVTITRTSDTNAPNDSKQVLVIKNTGTASPNCGGFYWGTTTSYRKVFITRIIAKIPSGRNISYHSNSIGTGGSQKWLTPVAGTGDWCEYICKVSCGTAGFSGTHYFAITGAVGTEDAPVEWRVAYATVFDNTSTEKYTTTIDANGIYTGTVKANQVLVDSALVVGGSTYNGSISVRDASNSVKVTLDRNGINAVGGTIAGWTISSNQISRNSVILGSDGSITNGTKWKLMNDGSGQVADGNVSWTAAGAVSITGTVNATAGTIGGFTISGNRLTNSAGDSCIYFDNLNGASYVRINESTGYLVSLRADSAKTAINIQTYASGARGISVIANAGSAYAVESYGPHQFGQRSGEKWNAPGVLFSALVKNSTTLYNTWGNGLTVSSFERLGTGNFRLTHNLGHTQYIVMATPYWDSGTNWHNNCFIRVEYITSTNFLMRVVNADNGSYVDTCFSFTIIGRNKW